MKYSLLCLGITAVAAMAQTPSLPPGEKGSISQSGKFQPVASSSSVAEAEKPETPVKQIGQDTFEIGRVVVDRKQRTVTIPAKVNMRQNLIEYAIVTPQGKRHESLLTTEAAPRDIHIACLLLGATESKVDGAPDKDVPLPANDAVSIEVTWEGNGPPVSRPLELLIGRINGDPQAKIEKTLSPGPWLYNGSIFERTGFAAQAEGSIISLIRDSSALINNPRGDRDNDKLHVPNEPELPPEGLPLHVVFRFPAPKSKPISK